MKSVLVPLAVALVLVIGAAVVMLGCCSTPEATVLPEDESRIEVLGSKSFSVEPTEPAPGVSPKPPAATAEAEAEAPAASASFDQMTYRPLELDGVRGGEIAFVVPGSVEQVTAMLLDFDNADGHRAWARSYRLISRQDDVATARWVFKGKAGIRPTVEIEFRTVADADATTIRYKLSKRAFGIASFFGDYKLASVSEAPARTRLTARTFIDSGIPFANATAKNIEDGLREDARLIRLWMAERLLDPK